LTRVRFAVLGGTGFIGHHVTRWLVEAGADVTTIQRSPASPRVPGARSLRADRKHTSTLVTALATAAPAVLIDMIGYTGEDMERLLTALPVSLQHLVVISSGDVYWTYAVFLGLSRGLPPAAPLNEHAPLREQLYPYRAHASGGTVRLNAAEAAWRCTRGYVEDVAWAIRLAVDGRAAGQILNVGEAQALPELEWVRTIAAAAGWSGQVISDPAAPPSSPVDWAMPLVVDTHRIREVLGYREPVGREDGLRRTTAALLGATP
jgi:nucleoside-diphosphate-sugar epimerase